MVPFHTHVLSLGLLAATAVNAQPVLTYATNAPLPGRSFTRNFGPWLAPGAPGANVTWDFTSLGIDSTETVQLVSPASTPFAAQFAGATVAETNGEGYQYFTATPNGVQRAGEAFDGQPVPYTDLGLYLPFPCTMGTTWTDDEAATYTAEGFTVNRSTTITGEADAYGTLLLPGGITAEVLRVHWQSSLLDDAGVFSYAIDVDSYLYYAVGTSYPLLQTVTSTVDFMGNEETFHFVQWMGDLTTTVPFAREQAEQLMLMPNPAQGTTQLLLPEAFRKEVYITLTDATGRLVKQYFLMDDGDGRSFIDLADMTTGQYFVTVENEQGQRTTVRLNVL